MRSAPYSMAAGLLLVIGCLSGCSTPSAVPVTRMIRVEHTSYLPIPPTLLAPCPAADVAAIKTNGDLLTALLADDAALEGCNVQLHAIGALKAPAPST